MGEGDKQECKRNTSVNLSCQTHNLACPGSHKYLKCGYCNNAKASAMKKRANRGWMAPVFA